MEAPKNQQAEKAQTVSKKKITPSFYSRPDVVILESHRMNTFFGYSYLYLNRGQYQREWGHRALLEGDRKSRTRKYYKVINLFNHIPEHTKTLKA